MYKVSVNVRFTGSNHFSALSGPAEEKSSVEKLCTQHRLRRADVARIDIGGANGIGGVGVQALEGVNSKRSLVSSPLAGRSENGQVPITRSKAGSPLYEQACDHAALERAAPSPAVAFNPALPC